MGSGCRAGSAANGFGAKGCDFPRERWDEPDRTGQWPHVRTRARRRRDESSQAGGGEEEESRGDLALGTGNCITPGPS